jgi:predicted amidohydrolase
VEEMPNPRLAAAQSSSIRGDIEGNVAHHVKLVETAAKHGVSFIVFPELSLTGYEPDLGRELALKATDPRLNPLREVAKEKGIIIVAGAPMLSNAGLHIAAFIYRPSGDPLVYTKHHLHKGEESFFAPGRIRPMVELEGEQVSLAICADTTHPSHAAEAARVGAGVYAAGVLITPSGIEADSAQLRGYALKHHMMVLMANHASPTGGWATAGRSAIWDEQGREVVVAPGSGEALLIASREGYVLRGERIRLDRG